MKFRNWDIGAFEGLIGLLLFFVLEIGLFYHIFPPTTEAFNQMSWQYKLGSLLLIYCVAFMIPLFLLIDGFLRAFEFKIKLVPN